MSFSGRTGGRYQLAALLLMLSMILTACMSSGGDDPTATPEPTATPTEEPQPTPTSTEEPTPTPEPTPTEEPYRPAPTVAVPRHQSTPTPIPAPTSTPEPAPEEGGLSEVYFSTLHDWAGGEVDLGNGAIGSGFTSDEGYHLYNSSPDGVAVWNGLTDIVLGDLVATVDLRMVSEGALGYGCLVIRTELDAMSYGYALCLNGQNQSVADFTYTDSEFIRYWDVLVDFGQREQSLPSNEWNNLMIAAVGQGFAFYVNDELIGTAEHDGPLTGQIGIFVYNFDEVPTEWVFTNLEIWAPE